MTNPPEDIALLGQLFITMAHEALHNSDLEELQLTPQQIMTLIVVYAHPGCTMSALATLLGTTAPQLTRTIHALVKRDLVARQPNPQNRRQINILRTKAGDAIAEAHMRRVQARIEQHFTNLSAQDRSQLTADVQDIIRLLTKAKFMPEAKP